MDLSSLHAWGQRGRVSARSFDGRPLGDLHRGSWWLPQAMWAKTPPALGFDRPTGVACCGEGHRDDGVGGPERGSRRRRGAIPRGQQRLSSNACGARPPCATQAGSSRGGRGGPLSVGAGGHVPSGRWPLIPPIRSRRMTTYAAQRRPPVGKRENPPLRARRLSIGLGSFIVALALVVAVGIGWAIAAIPHNGTFFACLTKRTGAIRVINHPKVQCTTGGSSMECQRPGRTTGPTGSPRSRRSGRLERHRQ